MATANIQLPVSGIDTISGTLNVYKVANLPVSGKNVNTIQDQFSNVINSYKGAFLVGMNISRIILGILIHIFFVVCLWKIFQKAGRKGRESLIPVRNIFVLFDIIGKSHWFWFIILPIVLLFVIIIFRLIMFVDTLNGTSTIFGGLGYTIVTLIYFITLILAFVLIILSCFRLAKKFGKSGGFGLGLLFLSPIFLGILAFGKSEYNEG